MTAAVPRARGVAFFGRPPAVFGICGVSVGGIFAGAEFADGAGPWASWSMSGPLAGSGRVQLRPVADSTTWSLWTICPLSLGEDSGRDHLPSFWSRACRAGRAPLREPACQQAGYWGFFGAGVRSSAGTGLGLEPGAGAFQGAGRSPRGGGASGGGEECG